MASAPSPSSVKAAMAHEEALGATVQSLAFNQETDCFAVGLGDSLRVYTANGPKEKMRRVFPRGGFSIVTMLHRTNYLALVGGGQRPCYPPNKVIIWDDAKAAPVIELEFRSDVKAVRLRRDRIVVSLQEKTFVYTFSGTPQRLHLFETGNNPHGLCSLSTETENAILAIPSKQPGSVQIINLYALKEPTKYLSSPTVIVQAHDTELACIATSPQGDRLATASGKGTLIRVWDTKSGMQTHELRRGADRAIIYSIAFHKSGTRLAVSSDKSTIHVFRLQPDSAQSATQVTKSVPRVPVSSSGNRQSTFKFMKPFLPSYFASEWSFAHVHLPTDAPCLAAFSYREEEEAHGTEALIVICYDGTWFKYTYDFHRGGEAIRDGYVRYLAIGK